jgi:5-methylcytosine-specific restriction enzyme A
MSSPSLPPQVRYRYCRRRTWNRLMPKRKAVPWEGDPRSWYQLERWRRIRRMHLQQEPLCRMCLRKGLAVPADVVDHIEPHKGDWNRFLTGPFQSLCKRCHDIEKAYMDRHDGRPRLTIGPDGWPIAKS